jgi:hypothetical protein
MARRSVASLFAAAAVSLVTFLSLAIPAHAVTLEQKLAAMSSFTQPTSTSFSEWNSAWQNQAAWADYAFNWSTDLCSSSPDQPLGFDFRMSCRRHDFGYRNYKAFNQFPSNKGRVDDAFYFDMRQECARHSGIARSTCDGLAWTYYQAVRQFGDLVVRDEQIQRVKREAVRQAQRDAA